MGAFVALSLSSPIYAQNCLCDATDNVRSSVRSVGDYLLGPTDATLAARRAELDKRANRLEREYAEYNAQVERFYWNTYVRQTHTELYLPQHSVLVHQQLPPAGANYNVNANPNAPAITPEWPSSDLYESQSVPQPAQGLPLGPRERLYRENNFNGARGVQYGPYGPYGNAPF